ncbi:uncharacterized protein [Haliotis asinina]|uniref:uncharacterized protein n=1 Tax=Haliotis asinina TaxID=109174 RepID=UPI00353261D2
MTTQVRETHTTQQVTQIFMISESAVESAPPPRHSHCNCTNMCVGIMSIILAPLSVAMVVFGILDYNLCPGHTKLAIYMIVQGATSVFIPVLVLCWCCCKWIRGKLIIAICAAIGLFYIGWGIVGSTWLVNSPCENTRLHYHAYWLSVPLWIFLVILACIGFCTKDDEDDD